MKLKNIQVLIFCLSLSALLTASAQSSLHVDPDKLNESIKPVAGEPLSFKTVKEGITLRPLYDIHREKYVVYWDIK
ncbi:MAG: DUF4986 domain-containing protein [Ferruginibacter sp.]